MFINNDMSLLSCAIERSSVSFFVIEVDATISTSFCWMHTDGESAMSIECSSTVVSIGQPDGPETEDDEVLI